MMLAIAAANGYEVEVNNMFKLRDAISNATPGALPPKTRWSRLIHGSTTTEPLHLLQDYSVEWDSESRAVFIS
ncbi:MAG: hypothetical protein FWB91_01585 [Defluviitaleaceae bacterium]|nr:hypothetical protein [Defluviitaleaceae bacterium]